MPSLQDQYDDAMFDFSTGNYESAITKLEAVLGQEPAHFEAQLALGMAYYRKGDYARAIAEGLERLLTDDALVASLRARGLSRAKLFSWETTGRAVQTAVREAGG